MLSPTVALVGRVWKNVLVAEFPIFVGDGEKIRPVFFQLGELDFLGCNNGGEVGFHTVIFQRSLDGNLGFHLVLHLIEFIFDVSRDDGGLVEQHHLFLHQSLEELEEVRPGLLTVRGAIDVEALVHVHQEGETVQDDAVELLGMSRGMVEPFIDLVGIRDLEGF